MLSSWVKTLAGLASAVSTHVMSNLWWTMDHKRSSGQCHLRNVRCAVSDVAGAHIPGRRPAGACQAAAPADAPCVCQVPQMYRAVCPAPSASCLVAKHAGVLSAFSCVATSRTEEEMLSQSQGPRRTQMKAGSSRTTLCKMPHSEHGRCLRLTSVCGDR